MIYLDHNATTPTDTRVLEKMLPFFTQNFGNSASRHHILGDIANKAIQDSRNQCASLIHANTSEVYFTSGATEGINMVLKGVFEKYGHQKNHLITVNTEHPAILDTCAYLETIGAEVTYLKVDNRGLISIDDLENAIQPTTLLVTIMWGNNETGVIQPMSDIVKIVQKYNVLSFSDATQVVGKIPIDLQAIPLDFMAWSGHKMYAPKGIGGVFIRNNQKLSPLIHGGGHQNGFRSGTLNVAGIVGFGEACQIASDRLSVNQKKTKLLRDLLEVQLIKSLSVSINGSVSHRLTHVTNICFHGVHSEDLLLKIRDEICASSGSACSSASIRPSHVLTAMGLTDREAYQSVRFSLGIGNKKKEILKAVNIIQETVKKLI